MMMDRDKLGFWARFIAIFLAVIFISSFVFLGIGGSVNYNLFDLIGGNQEEQGQTAESLDEQVNAAEQNLQENPDDPEARLQAGALYLQVSQFENAERVLQEGRERQPENADFASLLGQTYEQQAATAGEGNREPLFADAAEQYIAAGEIEPENADFPLLAGQAYENADDSGRAIQYYNAYLDVEPDGENSEAVRQRVEQLLNPEDAPAGQEGGQQGAGDSE